MYPAAGHTETLYLLIQVAVLLLVARLLGEVAQRHKQPSIVGELAAGMLLGPSCLGHFFPALLPFVSPQSAPAGLLLGVFPLLGAMFLLLNAGRETDLTIIRKHVRTALAVSVSGILFPFVGGVCLGQTLPDFLMGAEKDRLLFSLFLGTALSISSISVISRVLMDLKLLRRDLGQITMAACTIDDTAGWILVSLVSHLARVGHLTLASAGQAVLSLSAFLLTNFTLGRILVKRALAVVQDELVSSDRLISLVVVLMFAWGAAAMAFGLEPVVGSFFLGVLLASRRRFPERNQEKIHSIARAVFVPLFFAVAGLKVQLIPLLRPHLLFYGLVFLLVASLGKILGTYLGARIVGRADHWTALALGAGMNARGSMEIIVASLGLSLNVIDAGMFSIIVVMAMTMSLLTPPALKWLALRVPADAQEASRLGRERIATNSRVGSLRRALMAVGEVYPGIHLEQCSALLERLIATRQIHLTLLYLGEPDAPSLEWAAANKNLLLKSASSPQELVNSVVLESQKDYGLLILESQFEKTTMGATAVDELIRQAPCMSLVYRPCPNGAPLSLKRILVLTNGRSQAEEAAHLALALMGSEDQVHFLHLLEPRSQEEPFELHAAEGFVNRLRELAEGYGANHSAEIRLEGLHSGEVVLDVIRTRSIELVILGIHLRMAGPRVYLGSRVRRVLNQAQCSVLLLFVPDL